MRRLVRVSVQARREESEEVEDARALQFLFAEHQDLG
jgi:hypothetical protein